MEYRLICRGKQIDNGEWVEGNLIYSEDVDNNSRAIIIPVKDSDMYTVGESDEDLGFENWYRVDPTTTCLGTGYKGVFEKDIFKYDDETYVVTWSDAFLRWEALSISTSKKIPLGEIPPGEIHVIGNELDDPNCWIYMLSRKENTL